MNEIPYPADFEPFVPAPKLTGAISNVRSMTDDLEWFGDIRPSLTSAYVIKGMLDQGAMSVLYGPSNSGKTFFALDLSFHIAASRQWRGHRVDGGGVVYMAAEGGNGIANRMVGLRMSTGATGPIPLALRRGGLDLLHHQVDVPRVVDLARHVANQAPVKLIVIDTLSRVLAGGDENGPADMTAFVRNVDLIRQQSGAHVMIVHHTGKDVARGARGHSSLRAATDTEIEVAVDEAGNRKARIEKQRDHSSGDEFPFRLSSVELGIDQDGDPLTTCIVEHLDGSERSSTTPPLGVCRAMLQVIDDGWKSGNPLTAAVQGKRTGRYAPRLLSSQFSLSASIVEDLIGSWTDNQIIMTDVVDRKSKRAGLRVLRPL